MSCVTSLYFTVTVILSSVCFLQQLHMWLGQIRAENRFLNFYVRMKTDARLKWQSFLRWGVDADSCWTGKMCLNRLQYLSTSWSRPQSRPCANPPRGMQRGICSVHSHHGASAVPERVVGRMNGLTGPLESTEVLFTRKTRSIFVLFWKSWSLNTVMWYLMKRQMRYVLLSVPS